MATKPAELVTPTQNDATEETTVLGEESEDDETEVLTSVAVKKDLEDEGLAIQGDLSIDLELLKNIPCPYTDIIAEFADVEIFMISVDSLLLEFSAHNYHNWLLGGQTIVLSEQINQFLTALDDLNAKFILVWFRGLKPLYEEDQFLYFLHSFIINYLTTSKWADSMECFSNPLDEKWLNFLYRLTPSFLLVSMENPSRNFVNEKIDFATRFISIAVQLITLAIPVVLFNGFTINFASVMAYRFSTVQMSITNLKSKISALWDFKSIEKSVVEIDHSTFYACKSVAEFWAVVVKHELQANKRNEEFELFSIAVLISALTCEKLGTARVYCFDGSKEQPPPAANYGRRRLFNAAIKILETAESHKFNFQFADLWDGRMVLAIYNKVASKSPILPFRLQDHFAKLHQTAGLQLSVPTDTADRLLDPLSTPKKTSQKLYIDELKLYKTDNKLLNEFIPEAQELIAAHGSLDDTDEMLQRMISHFSKWKFDSVPDKLLELEKIRILREKQMSPWKLSRSRINLSKWYQNFADSLEGRGNDLLVDFSRTPRLPTINESEDKPVENESEDKPLEPAKATNGVQKKGGGGKPGSGGGKKGGKLGKDAGVSKKDLILKANRDSINKKQVENDKTKIAFATQVKAQAIPALEDVFRKLELQESKALCIFEKVVRHMELFSLRMPNFKTIEQKRNGALELVEALKLCTTKFFHYLDDSQKGKINNFWFLLGFLKTNAKRRAVEKVYDLEINLIDYQLYYGGRLIDILSDPQKDDRVVGFSPDRWQRKMLDVVDQNKSALIIAPTSAGKTFVSYYCIEKVLRKNSDDVVVYVSPSKALMNQVVGSVYARFRNKTMVGGKVLHGTFTLEYSDNCLNCQVLATIPECLEILLLSTDPVVQQFVSRIRYVILDEVHCINASNQPGQIWEHIFLLIRSPFLALSATISNVEMVRKWLQSAENVKAMAGERPRHVELITYDERWSELELAIAGMHEIAERDASAYVEELELFNRGGSVASISALGATDQDEEASDDESSRPNTPSVDEQSQDSKLQLLNDLILTFHPYGVYKPEKLKMFGIPGDQQLTAHQIVELYSIMSEIDVKVKEEFEPSKYFGYKLGSDEFVWLNRLGLRDYETKLKDRFLEWLKNDVEKTQKVFNLLDVNVYDEFEKRAKPFNMRITALHNIVPLMDNLKREDRLPALCFNDDRDICEWLAVRVFTEMENREFSHLASAEFKRRFNFKAEDKAAKLAKRKRDAEARAKKKTKSKKKGDDRENDNEADDARDWDAGAEASDQFLLQKIRLEEELKKFKFYGRWSDEDIYNKTLQRLLEKNTGRLSTQRLARLFKRGIGFHHEGLTAVERGAVEILFRAGFLGIVFSTSTLALGMNMPCKTVVFGIDTPMLTPLQYRQMSGRAGRRGFDPSGTVIFMSLPTSKIRRLLTSSLATLRGNVPYTTSFLLKLFGYIKGAEKTIFTAEEVAIAATGAQLTKPSSHKKNALIDTTDVTTTTIRCTAALSLLRTPLVLHTRQQSHFKALERLLKYMTFFNVQLLRKYKFLNEKCELTGFAYMATHLSNFEPGNLVFTILLESCVLHDIEHEYEDSEKSKFKDVLVNILAHIFTDKFLPIYAYENSVVSEQPILKAMPEQVVKVINTYQQDVDKLLMACLQLATPSRRLQNKTLQLSGKCDVFKMIEMNVVPVLDQELIHDSCFVPTIRLQLKDHRGRSIHRNSYAYDFWKRGDQKSLVEYNKLSIGEIWYLINTFTKVLHGISVALSSMAKPKDPIKCAMEEITKEYEYKFKRAFGMLKKEDEEKEKEG